MRKWYKRVTALVLAALMTVHHGGSNIAALADQTDTDKVHEDSNSEEDGNGENSIGGGASTDNAEDKDQQDQGNASDKNGDTGKNQDADKSEGQNADHQDADQNADKDAEQGGQNDQNSKSEGSQSGLNDADSKADQNENGADKKDSVADSSDIKQDGEKDQENNLSENPSGQQDQEEANEEEADEDEEDKELEVPTATSSEASRQDPATDPKEADKQEKHTIYSWEWFEGEDYLVDGEQFITVNEGDNISADMIAETLPKAISAELRYEDVMESVDWVEDIDVEKWICDEYVQDENGNWPTEGEFIFNAVLPEEYELAEETKKLEVKVTLVDSGVALLADYSDYIEIDQKYKKGYSIKQNGNEYVLTLNSDFNLSESESYPTYSINIKSGKWKIEVKGTVDVKGSLNIAEGAEATIQEGTLNVTGMLTGILVYGTLIIENQTVSAGAAKASNTDGYGINVGNTGKLIVSGASKVTCNSKGENGYDLFVEGTVEINNADAVVSANTSNVGIYIVSGSLNIYAGSLETGKNIFMNRGTFEVAGNVKAYQLIISSLDTARVLIKKGGSVEIESLRMSDSAHSNADPNGSLVTLDGGSLTTDGIRNECGTFTMNSGTLTLNGTYSANATWLGKLVYNGGTITGSGSLPSDYKISRTFPDKTLNRILPAGQSSMTIDVKKELFGSDINGTIDYNSNSSSGWTNGNQYTITPAGDGTLTIREAGTVSVKASFSDDRFYKATSSTLTVTVIQGSVDTNSLNVTAYNGTYDGKNHELVTVTYEDKTFTENEIKCALTDDNENVPTEFTTLRDISYYNRPHVYSGKYCWVQVQISGKPVVKCSSDKIKVDPYDLSQLDVNSVVLTGTNPFTYNDGKKNDSLTIKFPRPTPDMSNFSSVEYENTDYEIVWKKEGSEKIISFGEAVDAGVYHPVVRATENSRRYKGQAEGNVTYTINPAEAKLVISSFDPKIYDGTRNLAASVNLAAKRITGHGAENVDRSNMTAEYDDPNAGRRTLTFSELKSNNKNPNYTIPSSFSISAVISKADFSKVAVSAADNNLIYTGKEQAAEVSIRADGINGESYSNAAGANNNIAEFDIKYGTSRNNVASSTVPAFKDAGEHTVYYEITATNYNKVTGSFKVKINKVSLDNVIFKLDNAEKTYNGSAQAPTLKAVIGQAEVEIPNNAYTLSYSKTDQENVGGTPVSEAVDVGTYTVTVKVNENDKFEDGEKKAETQFVISPKDLSDDTITVSFDQHQFTYNTQVQKPNTITVSDSETGTVLTKDIDYTVTEPDNMVDAKTYEYTFTGKGNYQGTTTGSVIIAPKSLDQVIVTVKDADSGYVYKAGEWIPGKEAVTVKIGDLVVDSNEYQLEYEDNINAGTAKVIVKANQSAGSSDAALPKNYTGSASGTFTIHKAPLTLENAVLISKKYDGSKDAAVADAVLRGLQGSDKLVIDKDYTALAYYMDVNAGTDKMFHVKVTLENTSAADNYVFLDEAASEITLYNGVISKAAAQPLPDINVSYSFGRTGEQTVQITGLPDAMGEFLGAEATVAEDNIDALEPDVTVDGDRVIFKLSGTKMENIGKSAKIIISNIETTNYENMTQNIVITMDHKMSQADVSCSMAYVANDDEETFTAVITPAKGAEYSFDGENWSEDNRKTDCQSDLEYTGYIRMKETEDLYAGAISSTTVKAPAATVKAPVISPDNFYINKLITVSLSTPTRNAVIYYTLDGTDPTRESSRYTGPFTVDTGLKVKAIAVREHFADSSVTEREYIWGSNSDGGNSQDIGTTKKTNQTIQSRTEVSRIDDQKGAINDLTGIITGEGEGYSRWEAIAPADEAAVGNKANSAATPASSTQWKLRYADGTYASGTVKNNADGSTYIDYCWEQVNGRWYAFNENAIVQNGWIYDTNLSSWFYVDADQGMRTGWQMIGGKWYYFHMVSDGTKGRMYTSSRTPDGYYVREDGSWDEKGV